MSFNPRSREGATRPLNTRCVLGYVSIHAPVKERLRQKSQNTCIVCGFNPRSREGATLLSSLL